MTVRVLSGADVRAALPMGAAIDAMERAFGALSEGRADVPLRTAIEVPEAPGTALFMPARVADGGLGAKVVSVFPGNAGRGLPTVHGLVVLLDPETGRPTAVLDGVALTAIRTGAASGLATRILARQDARRLAVIGSGAQARTQLEAVCTVREIDGVRVYSRTRSHAERFAEEMAGRGPVPGAIEVVGSSAEACAGADIVCAATSSATPVLSPGSLDPGVHVNGIGSYTPSMRELPPELLERARVFVDQRTASMSEAGELIAAVEDGRIREADLTELGDVVTGREPGRRAPGEWTVFKSVGLAIQDMCAGQVAVERAGRAELGVELGM